MTLYEQKQTDRQGRYRLSPSKLLLLVAITLFVLPAKQIFAKKVGFDWVGIGSSTGSDMGMGITVDDSGYVYTTGHFADIATFGSGNNTVTLRSEGQSDIYIAKQGPKGNFLWVRSLGGLKRDWGRSITVDGKGNVYVTGEFADSLFYGSGNTVVKSGGGSDIFVAKLNTDGDFEWVKPFGGSGGDVGYGIAVDEDGNAFITGYFEGKASFGAITLISQATLDIFIAKINGKGDVVWAESFGVAGARGVEHGGQGITVDSKGDVIATGYFAATVDFDPGANTYNLTSPGGFDIFLLKLTNAGNFVWAKNFGDGNGNRGHSVAVDKDDNIALTGYFKGAVNFNVDTPANPVILNASGPSGVFTAKFDADGRFAWAKSIGGMGSAFDQGMGVGFDSSGNVYTTGNFMGANVDFDPGSGTFLMSTTLTGTVYLQSMFIQKLDKDGNFDWAITTPGYDRTDASLSSTTAQGIAVTPEEDVHSTGFFQYVVDFDPGPDSFKVAANGYNPDIFILKLSCVDSSVFNMPVTTCDAEYVLNDVLYDQPGTYRQYFLNAAGCDSVVVLDLKINFMIPAVITVDSFSLSTSAPYDSYQWFLNDTLLTGETNRTLTVSSNGYYSVAVESEKGCRDTAYYEVNNYTGIERVDFEGLKVYPNPTEGVLYIHSADRVNVRLAAIDGRILIRQHNVNSIDLSGLAEGFYLAYIYDSRDALIKVIKVNKR